MQDSKENEMTLVKRKTLWVAVPLMCAAVAALTLVSAGHGPVEESTWKQSDLALGQPPSYTDSIEDVSLMLNSSGFVPTELRPQSKRFLLSLDNRTNLKELVLRLSGNDGNQIRELKVRGGDGDWSELFELQPGTYTLSEASHPGWTCNVIIGKKPS